MPKMTACFGIMLLSFTSVSDVRAQPVAYQIEPYTLTNGYEVAGGFIQTDGTAGPLLAENILNYEVTVLGDVPFVFQPSNPDYTVRIQGDITSNSQGITASEDLATKGIGSSATLEFRYFNSSTGSPGVHLTYNYSVGTSHVDFLARYLWIGATQSISEGYSVPADENTIVASIPEPTTMLLSLAALAISLGLRDRR